MDDKFTIKQDVRGHKSVDGSTLEFETQSKEHPLLFEMLRSFTTLARTLNLSHAVKELNSTRQTLRRHIGQLEEMLGGPLFEVKDRQYELTELGVRELSTAKDLLSHARAWVNGQISNRSGLQSIRNTQGEWCYYQQQHPIGRIWTHSSPLMAETFRAWSMAGASIENPALQHVRPFVIVYRQAGEEWLCVEFGERSFYVGWFGLDFARSSIGRPLGRMPGGEEFASMVNLSFADVQETQSARLDHVFTKVPNVQTGALMPVAYERLMMCGRFPDDSLAVLSLVVPRRDVVIEGLNEAEFETIEDFATVTFDKSDIRLDNLQL